MFGLGFSELVLFLCVAIILIRPDDFPKVVYQIGRVYGKCRAMYYNLINEFYALVPSEEERDFEEPENRVKR